MQHMAFKPSVHDREVGPLRGQHPVVRRVDDIHLDSKSAGMGGFHVDDREYDIAEIMGLRDRWEAPCRVVLELLEQKAQEVARRIEALQRFEVDLWQLHQLGQTFPLDDVDGKACVCHLVSRRAGLTALSSGKEAEEALP